MMNSKRELLLIENTDLGPIIDDVLQDLRTGVHADLLAILAEAKLSGLPWRTVLSHLDDADLDTGRGLIKAVLGLRQAFDLKCCDCKVKLAPFKQKNRASTPKH